MRGVAVVIGIDRARGAVDGARVDGPRGDVDGPGSDVDGARGHVHGPGSHVDGGRDDHGRRVSAGVVGVDAGAEGEGGGGEEEEAMVCFHGMWGERIRGAGRG